MKILGMIKHAATRYRVICSLALLMGLGFSAGGGIPSTALARPIFTLDAAGFHQGSGLVYLEVYLLIQRAQMKFLPVEGGLKASLEITLKVYSPDSLLSTTSWPLTDKIARAEDLTPRQKLPDMAGYNLRPGKYTLEARVRDVNLDSTSTQNLSLELVAFSDSALCLSDIELATRLEKTDTKGKFSKNGFLVIPNPDRLYGPSMQLLPYYAELYNLKGTTGTYTVDRLILDNQRKEIKRLPQKERKKVGASVVEVDGFSTATLASGTYYLQIVVADSGTKEQATREAKFFIYRTEDFAQVKPPPALTASQLESEILQYNDEQVTTALEQVRAFLSASETRSLDQLNKEGKRKLLIQFWNEHDPDPQTPVNEFKQTFEARKNAADRFAVLNKPGWQTDRGRVFILYGPPDWIDNHSHDLDTRPFEIWQYDSIEGGVSFVFLDRNNFGDYRLVHSTKSGEVNRPNWLVEEALIQVRNRDK